ncbi:MAG: nucleotide exchange factor GrpE [Acidobacteria bacterium]|nr:nucleotide exchange factor GrpE [Acidobacteriota bacterium]
MFEQTLLSLGVEPIDTVGADFDPELHEAVEMVEADEGTGRQDHVRILAQLQVRRPASAPHASKSESQVNRIWDWGIRSSDWNSDLFLLSCNPVLEVQFERYVETGIRNAESGIRSPRSGIWNLNRNLNPESEISEIWNLWNLESEIWNLDLESESRNLNL